MADTHNTNNNTYTTSNKVIDLISDSYNLWLNSLVWGSERMLEFNKAMVAQLEVTQKESRKYVREVTEKARETRDLASEVWQDTVRGYSNGLNNLRGVNNVIIDEVQETAEDAKAEAKKTAAHSK